MILTSEYTPMAAKAQVGLAAHNAFRIHIGVRYYNAAGDGTFTEVNPTAGSVDITVAKPTLRAPKAAGTLVSTDLSTDLIFDGPVTEVFGAKNVTFVGATHYKLVVCTEK